MFVKTKKLLVKIQRVVLNIINTKVNSNVQVYALIQFLSGKEIARILVL